MTHLVSRLWVLVLGQLHVQVGRQLLLQRLRPRLVQLAHHVLLPLAQLQNALVEARLVIEYLRREGDVDAPVLNQCVLEAKVSGYTGTNGSMIASGYMLTCAFHLVSKLLRVSR